MSFAQNQRGEVVERDHTGAVGGTFASQGQGIPFVRTSAPTAPEAAPVDPKPDGRRYSAVGDAVTVNVALWIGWRLNEFAEGDS